ncbi:MAG: response regulator [Nitrospirota bacterium]|nr:response regulator [Nitrospirota bacterium]
MNELVLIVEDERSLTELLGYNLQKAGYRTAVAENGAQAIRNVRSEVPDIVLLDILLPEMDGWEVCRMLRNSKQGSTLPIIMVTALASEDIRIRGLREGADDVIAKPFVVGELLFKVRKLLDKNMVISAFRNRTEGQDASMRHLIHELRNSLSVIGGYANLAASRENSEPWVKHVVSAADRMEQLLSNAATAKFPEKEAGEVGGPGA